MPTDIQPNTLFFGSDGNDTLAASGGNVAIGLSGDDTLTASGTLGVLHGGQGNDRYQANAWVTQIVDSGGSNDSLTLPGHVSDYVGGVIEGRHLLLYNAWSGDSTLVMDWRGSGRIEHFHDGYGNYLSAAQVDEEISREGYSVSYRDVANELGISNLDADQVRALFDVDERLGKLDWENVFQELATADLDDTPQVTEAIRGEVFEDLGPAARSLWDEMNYDDALAASQTHGLADNVERANRPVAESVALLYAAALDRQPEEAGYTYWLEQAFDGMGLAEMSDYFLASEEFQSRFDVQSDAAYIDRLYLNVLDRTADAEGKAYWEATMADGLPRDEVLMYFATSAENRDSAEWLAGLSRQDDGGWLIEG